MDFVYRLLTPSLTKGGLNDHETFNNILAFFQSNAGGTVQEVFPEEFSISQLPTSLEDIDQVIGFLNTDKVSASSIKKDEIAEGKEVKVESE